MSLSTQLVRLALEVAPRNKLSILIFHRVLKRRDPMRPSEPTVEEFERQIRWVSQWFKVLPLTTAARGLRDGLLPPRSLSITFDDGYADNFHLALPVLRRLGLPATFFVATGYLDGGVMFNDQVIEAIRQAKGEVLDLSEFGLGTHSFKDDAQRKEVADQLLKRVKHLPPKAREEAVAAIVERSSGDVPRDLMMRSEEVAKLSAYGIEVGAHTVSHPILTSIGPLEARREILDGKSRLESITGRKVTLFAYPNGGPARDYAKEHVVMAREAGFEAAVSTAWGAATPGDDLYQLPRFTPWDRSPVRYGARLLQTLTRRTYELA